MLKVAYRKIGNRFLKRKRKAKLQRSNFEVHFSTSRERKCWSLTSHTQTLRPSQLPNFYLPSYLRTCGGDGEVRWGEVRWIGVVSTRFPSDLLSIEIALFVLSESGPEDVALYRRLITLSLTRCKTFLFLSFRLSIFYRTKHRRKCRRQRRSALQTGQRRKRHR